MNEEPEYEDSRERPLRSQRKIPFFRRLVLKLRFQSKIKLLVIIIVIILVILGVDFFIHVNNASQNNTASSITPIPSPSDTPIESPSPKPIDTSTDSNPSFDQTARPNVSPTVDCIGPDGKHLYVTQQQCDAFNTAWATPTPTVIPTKPTVTPAASPTDTPAPTNTPTPQT